MLVACLFMDTHQVTLNATKSTACITVAFTNDIELCSKRNVTVNATWVNNQGSEYSVTFQQQNIIIIAMSKRKLI